MQAMSRFFQSLTRHQHRVFGSVVAVAALLCLSPAHAQIGRGGGGHGGGGGGQFGGGFHGGSFHGGGGSRGGGFHGGGFHGHFAGGRGWRGGWGGFGFGFGYAGYPYDDDWYDAYDAYPYYGAPYYPAATPYAAGSSWYYCQSPAGYYPYVQQCAVAWQPVAPRG
jgi:hypothetical protein